ncbi:hypothetical protein GCM10009549_58300 [Streptomyces thermoalcalitolerans]|uniref:HNH endonuclease n=1 Tax=Streptomyces thermoalcalitolerans TaxID=65605 RepID=A0ABN1PY90_9ACTN
MTDTVYVATNGAGGGARKLHTERDCPCLTSARNVVEKDRQLLEGHKELCRRCAGEQTTRNYESYIGKGHREALLDADPEVVG